MAAIEKSVPLFRLDDVIFASAIRLCVVIMISKFFLFYFNPESSVLLSKFKIPL